MSSKSLSNLGVSINSPEAKPLPIISYTEPACSGVAGGYYQDMCLNGSHSGFVIDSICNCYTNTQHVFTVDNVIVDGWRIDYLGGNMKPNIVSSSGTTLIIDLSLVPSSTSTPLYCGSTGITDSAFEITAFHDYAENTVKVIAIQC